MKAYPDSEHKVLNNRYIFYSYFMYSCMQYYKCVISPFRRLMHWFSYILLFQNAFVGIFSTFLRVIVSLSFGLLTFSRLDHSFLIREWEWMDSGIMSHIFVSTVTVLRIFLANKTYMGMIYLDYRENNINNDECILSHLT